MADHVKDALLRNDKIEDTLHVIAVVYNPCNFKRRYKLTHEFIGRMEKEPAVTLHVVELVYDDQAFAITSADNPNHLQLRGGTPLWHKENLINLGVRRLLPANWKAVAWVDTEVEFESALGCGHPAAVECGGQGLCAAVHPLR